MTTETAARAELALVDGFAPPRGLPEGALIASLRDGQPWIDHADPRIVISAEVIDSVARGGARPEVTLDRLDFTVPNGHAGALLKVRGINRTVIYRLTEYVPSIHAYVGEQPD